MTTNNRAGFEAGKDFFYTFGAGISNQQIKAIAKATGSTATIVKKGFFAAGGEMIIKDGYEKAAINA